MRLFLRSDRQRKIFSVMKVRAMPETLMHPSAHPPAEGEEIVEIDPNPNVAAIAAHEVAEQYSVKIATGMLRKM